MGPSCSSSFYNAYPGRYQSSRQPHRIRCWGMAAGHPSPPPRVVSGDYARYRTALPDSASAAIRSIPLFPLPGEKKLLWFRPSAFFCPSAQRAAHQSSWGSTADLHQMQCPWLSSEHHPARDPQNWICRRVGLRNGLVLGPFPSAAIISFSSAQRPQWRCIKGYATCGFVPTVFFFFLFRYCLPSRLLVMFSRSHDQVT